MRTWNDLSEEEKTRAVAKIISEDLSMLVQGAIAMPNPDDQKKFEKACEDADKAYTPWFVGEFIMEVVGSNITLIAEAEAKEALYPESERIVWV